ncbi:hypothetical protein DRO91_10250, partial [Candidatus Heimdallarchaeota archaeon]
TEGKLEAAVSPVFGRCRYFVIAEIEGNEIKGTEIIENPAATAATGAGIQAAQLVANKGVKVVITGHVGPNAISALKVAGIEVVLVSGISVKDALDKYAKGELKPSSLGSFPPTPPGPIVPRRGRFGGPPVECVCPSCGFRIPKIRGVPCAQQICPNCGARMVRA